MFTARAAHARPDASLVSAIEIGTPRFETRGEHTGHEVVTFLWIVKHDPEDGRSAVLDFTMVNVDGGPAAEPIRIPIVVPPRRGQFAGVLHMFDELEPGQYRARLSVGRGIEFDEADFVVARPA